MDSPSPRSESLQSRNLGAFVAFLQDLLRRVLVPLHQIPMPSSACTILELGCGQGLLLAQIAERQIPGQQMIGVDLDSRKCASARDRLQQLGGAFTIFEADMMVFADQLEESTMGWIYLVDTLSSIPWNQQEKLLLRSIKLLESDGTLVIKVMDTHPRWRFFLSKSISWMVYRILRLSLSQEQRFFHQPSERYQELLKSMGMQVFGAPMRSWPLPHTLIVAQKIPGKSG